MSERVTYFNTRYKLWADYDASYEKLAKVDTFESSWEHPSDLPTAATSLNLGNALCCAYAGNEPRAEVFLKRAVYYADRLVAEKRYLDTEIAEAGHPRNLGVIIRCGAYARWLLGEPLDRKVLRQVAEHLITWCLTKAEDRKRINSSFTMNYYMQGIRAAMIACDLDYAADLLRSKHKMRWHHGREAELWKRLIEQYPDVTDAFDAEFEAFFDQVRDPDFSKTEAVYQVAVNTPCLALETGILREMYIIRASPLDPVDPQAVLRAVAR